MPESQPEQRVLAIFANPKGTDSLRLGEEDRVLRECLRLARYRRLRLEARHAATVHDLRRELLDEHAHVIHFSGHGTGQGLAFEDEAGNVKLIPPRALGELLSAYVPPVHTVVLNACYSSVHADALKKIPYVVVMRQAIADEVAIEFARGFYDALAAGKGSEFAFFEGLRTVSLVGLQGEDIPQLFEMGSPVLVPKSAISADGGVELEAANSTTDHRTANINRSPPDQNSTDEEMISRVSGGSRRVGLATAVASIFLALLLMIIVWNLSEGRQGETEATAPIAELVATDSVATDTSSTGNAVEMKPTPQERVPLVLVLDSQTRERALADVVRALDPLERNGKATIAPAAISADEAIRDRLGAMRPDVVVAHLHAYRPVSKSDPDAEAELLSQLSSFHENNSQVRYIVYSRSFSNASTRARQWLASVAKTAPSLVAQIQPISVPDQSPLPETTRQNIRDLVTAALALSASDTASERRPTSR
jgi:hypothetical protein